MSNAISCTQCLACVMLLHHHHHQSSHLLGIFYIPGTLCTLSHFMLTITLYKQCACVCVCVCVLITQSCSTLLPHGPVRLLCPWNFPGKNTGVGWHSLLQGIFPTQGSNICLLCCRQILYHLRHQGGPTHYEVSNTIIPFYRWRNWGLGSLNSLLKD